MYNKYANKNQADHYIVSGDTPLLEYLLANVKGISRNKIKDTLKGSGIKVDGKTVTQYDFPLKKGMHISVSRHKDKLHILKNRYVKLIYEDQYLVVIDKSAGILSMGVGQKSFNVKAVLDKYFQNSHQKCRAHVVHRLDRDTSGLMIYAKDIDVEQIFEHSWRDIVYDRRYVALVSGEVEEEGGTVSNWLAERGKERLVVSSPVEIDGGKYAVTHFHTLERSTGHSLVEFSLETGRKHQIRVHAAEIGHPLCGDRKYGNGDDPLHRLCLHAYILCFRHPVTHERLEFKTMVPAQWNSLLK